MVSTGQMMLVLLARSSTVLLHLLGAIAIFSDYCHDHVGNEDDASIITVLT